MNRLALLLLTVFSIPNSVAQPADPVRVAVAGMTHGHVGWILRREPQPDIELVGIWEPDQELAQKYSERFGFPMSLVYEDLDQMLDRTQPEAVTAFNSIQGHLEVVEACAPRGIHVMVEKPLATTVEQAERMARLAIEHQIHILTNYETTWYSSSHEAFRLIHEERQIGEIRKIVVHDGHQGPQEIGVGPEFLAWLSDPVENGGGASIDFGCYGANLITWLMKGERPRSVTAVFQQIKPEIYPRVDDEATIILTYPRAQGIIQASWNWPFNRKDLEVYGQSGYIHTLDARRMRLRFAQNEPEEEVEAPPALAPATDPFNYLARVVRGELHVASNNLSALSLNLTVVEILSAARESARTGRTVQLAQ